MTKNDHIEYLDFKTASYIINAELLINESVMVIGKNGIGKTELAKVFCAELKDRIIPLGAIDMGGLRDILRNNVNDEKDYLLISDLQAFFRSKGSRQKLISYLTTMLTDSTFEDASFDSKVKIRQKPRQCIIFGTEDHLKYLFRERKSDFLDRFLVFFVDREIDDYVIDNDIPYSLEITPSKSINGEMPYEVSKALIQSRKLSPRKKKQIYKLQKALYEIGFNGNISIYNTLSPPSDYEHYYDRVWSVSPFRTSINQAEFEYWMSLLGSTKNKKILPLRDKI